MAPSDSSRFGGRVEQGEIDRQNALAMWSSFGDHVSLLKERTQKILFKQYATVKDRNGWLVTYNGLIAKLLELYSSLSEERYKKHLKDPEALEKRFAVYKTEVAPYVDQVVRVVRSLPAITSDRIPGSGASMRGTRGGGKHRKSKE